MIDGMEPATRIQEFTQDIIEFCESDSHLFLEMIKERDNFFTKTPEKHYRTQEDEGLAEQRFEDYFIYSYTSKHYRQKPIEVFLSRMLSHYSQKDQNILKGFKNDIFGAFRVGDVLPGVYFMAKDLASGKEYKVRERKASFKLQKNDNLVGRILPYETDYALSVINLFLPDLPSYETKRLWQYMPSGFSNEIDPLKIEKLMLQKKMESIEKEDSLEFIEKKLENFLKKRLGKKAPSIKSLRKKVNRTIDPLSVIKELAKMMHISSKEEFYQFQQLFYDFWNHAPRDEFQGKSPEEIAKDSIGPLENVLLKDFMNYVEKNIDISQFSNQNEIEKAIREIQEKWLAEPQEELNGKTPFQAIKEERKKINSPRKDFPFSVNITPIDLDSKSVYNLKDISQEDSPVVRDVETFVRYFQENRVKVTAKNHWIPFKHLKIIEKNFINPTKDSYKFLDEEESRGEEKEKPYIHFIHLLSRAKRLIQNTKEGYVQVNQKHFKSFTENGYGENVLKLIIDWIEKVNWVDLQPADHLKPYAREYQEKIVGLWHPLFQFKPNEKVKTANYTKELYKYNIKEPEELEEVARELATIVNAVLIRYLKWFGVVSTLEEKLHPKLEVRLIKEFWVTPKGKKLVDRIVVYFWEKGRIKLSDKK